MCPDIRWGRMFTLTRRRYRQTLLSRSGLGALAVVVSLSVIINGCSRLACCMSVPLRGSHDSIHYLVIGLGLISVPKPEQETVVLATKMQALGVSITDQAGLK